MSAYYKDNIFYIGEFDGNMEANVLLPLHFAITEQAKKANGYLDLYVNSYGGNAAVAQHVVELVEIAKRQGVVVRTIVTSAAYSAGSIVAVAGSPGHRYIAREAQHLVHYGTFPSGDSVTPEQADRVASASMFFFKQTLRHYQKYCDIPDLEENLEQDDWYITSQKAIKWNMADKLLDKFNPLGVV